MTTTTTRKTGKTKRILCQLLALAMVFGLFAVMPPAARAANEAYSYRCSDGVLGSWRTKHTNSLYDALSEALSIRGDGKVTLERDHVDDSTPNKWLWILYSGNDNVIDLNGYDLTVYCTGLGVKNNKQITFYGNGSATFIGASSGLYVSSGNSSISPVNVIGPNTEVTFRGYYAGAYIDASEGMKNIGSNTNYGSGNLAFESYGVGPGVLIYGANPIVNFRNIHRLDIFSSYTAGEPGISFEGAEAYAGVAKLSFSNIYDAYIVSSADYGIDFPGANSSLHITNNGCENLEFQGPKAGIRTAGRMWLEGNSTITSVGDRSGIYVSSGYVNTITVNTGLETRGEHEIYGDGILVDAPGLIFEGSGSIYSLGVRSGINFTSALPTTMTNNLSVDNWDLYGLPPSCFYGVGDDYGAGIISRAADLTFAGSTSSYFYGDQTGLFLTSAGAVTLTNNITGSYLRFWGKKGEAIYSEAYSLVLNNNKHLYLNGENDCILLLGTRNFTLNNTSYIGFFDRQTGPAPLPNKKAIHAASDRLTMRANVSGTLYNCDVYADGDLDLFDIDLPANYQYSINQFNCYATGGIYAKNSYIENWGNRPTLKANGGITVEGGRIVNTSSVAGTPVLDCVNADIALWGGEIVANGLADAIHSTRTDNSDYLWVGIYDSTVKAASGSAIVSSGSHVYVEENSIVSADGANATVKLIGDSSIDISDGGVIEACGTGHAIDLAAGTTYGASVGVGGLVRAREGRAVNAATGAGPVNIRSGAVFAYGNTISDVVAAPGFSGPVNTGVLIAWDAQETPITYEHGTKTDLRSFPGDTALWNAPGQGIRYKNGSNIGVITIDGVSVREAEYSYSVSVNGVEMPLWPAYCMDNLVSGYTNAAPAVFTIKNTGTGMLTGLDVSMATTAGNDFTLGKTGMTPTLAPGATATFTVTPGNGMSIGTHEALVYLNCDEVTYEFIEYYYIMLRVTSAPTTELLVVPPPSEVIHDGDIIFSGGQLIFDYTDAGYAPIAPQTFTIRNIGNTTVSGLTAMLSGGDAAYFTFNTAGMATSLPPGGYTTFTIKPNDDLPVKFNNTNVSSYSTSLNISGNAPNDPAFTANVSFLLVPIPGSATVTQTTIAGVTAPVAGAVPVRTITPSAQFTGVVTWSPAHSEFQYDTQYTATIQLYPATGYIFAGVFPNSFTVAGATAVSNPVNSGTVTAVFPATVPETLIDISVINGVTAPVAGELPVSSIMETAQFYGIVEWSPNDYPFEYDTVYTAIITLFPKPGYTLIGLTGGSFSVPGATRTRFNTTTGQIAAEFPETEPDPVMTISLIALPGVTVPKAGDNPVLWTETEQYIGRVQWSPDDPPFEYDTEYTATIIIHPKPGYTLNGLEADCFKIEGAVSATNEPNSGVIKVSYPKTEPAPPDPDILYGDVNGDGRVNALDMAYLARHFAGWAGYETVGPGADVNGDGRINALDLAYLARHFAGWAGYEKLGP